MAFDTKEVRQDSAGEHVLLQYSQFSYAHEFIVAGEARVVTFRTAEASERLQAACDLLNERYGWRGYGSSHSIPSSEHHTTFVAELDGAVVGTITLAIDAGSWLAIDNTFGDVANAARNTLGVQICELTRFAVDPSLRSKEILAGLFHLAFIHGTSVSNCTDLFIEVHPRHAGFYESMLGFQRVGPARTNEGVSAPAQLMRLKVDAIRQNILSQAGNLDSKATRSLYPYFFNASEETEIRQSLDLKGKMRRLLAEGLTPGRSPAPKIWSSALVPANQPSSDAAPWVVCSPATATQVSERANRAA